MNDKPVKKKKKWKRIVRKIIIWLLVLLILAAAGFYMYQRLKAEYTVNYDSYTASVGTISNSLSFSGSLQLIDSASYTANSSSQVRTVYVSAGEDVEEGDKLVRLANGQTVEAGFDGRVNRLNAEPGKEVKAEDELVQIADFNHMKVSVRVDEYDIADVAVGQNCKVTATATEQTFDSTIASIDYISSSGGSVAYYTAVVYVDVDGGVYPGMQVTVTIPQEEAADVVILKADALSFDETNQAFVYKKNDAGELEKVNVTTGVSNGNYVEITEGLSDGDEVFVEAEVENTSAVDSLLSGLFGRQQFNPQQGGNMRGSMRSGDMPDFSNMRGGNMPSIPGNMGSSGSGSFGGGSR